MSGRVSAVKTDEGKVEYYKGCDRAAYPIANADHVFLYLVDGELNYMFIDDPKKLAGTMAYINLHEVGEVELLGAYSRVPGYGPPVHKFTFSEHELGFPNGTEGGMKVTATHEATAVLKQVEPVPGSDFDQHGRPDYHPRHLTWYEVTIEGRDAPPVGHFVVELFTNKLWWTDYDDSDGLYVPCEWPSGMNVLEAMVTVFKSWSK